MVLEEEAVQIGTLVYTLLHPPSDDIFPLFKPPTASILLFGTSSNPFSNVVTNPYETCDG